MNFKYELHSEPILGTPFGVEEAVTRRLPARPLSTENTGGGNESGGKYSNQFVM